MISALVIVVAGCSTQSAPKLAAQLTMETWGLLEAIDERDTWNIMMDRLPDEIAVMSELVIPEPKRAGVEAWAKEHKLERIDRSWIRKLRPGAPDVSGIVIDLEGAKLSVHETRASKGSATKVPACQDHPSRTAPKPANSAHPQESDDELIRRMMGK